MDGLKTVYSPKLRSMIKTGQVSIAKGAIISQTAKYHSRGPIVAQDDADKVYPKQLPNFSDLSLNESIV